MDFTFLQQLGVATALGALIGIERERKHQLEKSDDTFGGIRTFALIGLMGALSFVLSSYSIVIFSIMSSALLILIIGSYVISSQKYGNFGITSEVASILVFMIGMLSGMQLYVEATIVALLVLSFLLFKNPLHQWAGRIKFQELISTLEFMIISFVVLPILPNQAYGPYGFFNPYSIWLFVVFISGISFVSYIAIKFWGAKKGLTLTGFLAGFISTTALAFSLAAQSKKNPMVVYPYVLAIAVASFAMLVRVSIEVMVLNFDLIGLLMIPILSMGIVGVVSSTLIWLKVRKVNERTDEISTELRSPFSLVPAVKFALFFVFVLLLSRVAGENMGHGGIYLTSFFSGLVDVDAITISMSNLAKTELNREVAVRAIVITVIVNTLVKSGIFFIFGARKVAKGISLVLVLMSIAGILSLFFI